jgi:hypothetical protein
MAEASAPIVAEGGRGMVAFLGVPADERLLDEDLVNLPDAEQYREPGVSSQRHDRLVAVGSLLTGSTLIGGAAMLLYGGWRVLFEGGGVFDVVLAVIGILLVGTHWGWVHVAEYVGLTIDEHQRRVSEERRREWLAAVQPYPRFSVSTSVLDDASTQVERILYRPVLTTQRTFTFVREINATETYDADASAAEIATAVETIRRQARLETDRVRELWEAAFIAYTAALLSANDDEQQRAAQQAAATALSEHINASLLEPPLVE